MYQFKIRDVHIHLGPSGPWTPDFDPSTTVDDVINFAKRYNITKCVVFPNPSVGTKYPRMNDYIAKASEDFPELFIPFGRIDPRYKRLAIKEIRRLAKKDFAGIKLHPVVECFRPDHPFFFDIYKEIIDYGLFVITHTSNAGFGRAEHWKIVCDKFDDLKLILSHLNETCINLIENYDDVYVDTSGYTFLKFSFELGTLNTKKIIFGSDYPYVKDISNHIEKIENSGLSKDQVEYILYKNFDRLFRDFIKV